MDIVYFDGEKEITKENVSIESIPYNETYPGQNATNFVDFVKFDSGKLGFFKKSSSSLWDLFEYIICQVGKKIGIQMSETYKVYDKNTFKGIISKVSYDSENEKMYSIDELLHTIETPSSCLHSYFDDLKELSRLNRKEFKMPNGKTFFIPIAQTEAEVDKALEAFPILIKELKKDKTQYEPVIMDYYKMLMLDLITNNVDRTTSNFDIIEDNNGKIRFAPLFDNSQILIKGFPNDTCRVANFMIKREILLKILFMKHYQYIEPIVKMCCENKTRLLDYVRSISNSNLSSVDANNFITLITNNILSICNLESQRRNGTLENEPTLEYPETQS